MKEELFQVPTGGKPALLQARERLVVAEAQFDKAVMCDDGAEAVEFWRGELREAKADVRRLELEALNQARGGYISGRALLTIGALLQLVLAAGAAQCGLFGVGSVLMCGGVLTALCAAETR